MGDIHGRGVVNMEWNGKPNRWWHVHRGHVWNGVNETKGNKCLIVEVSLKSKKI